MTTTDRPPELDELITLLVAAEIRARRAQEAADARADELAAARIVARLPAGPVRVRVTYRSCDLGRVGVVRRPPAAADDGTVWAYVEDMTPGDDGNPTRYHRPMHLDVLPPAAVVRQNRRAVVCCEAEAHGPETPDGHPHDEWCTGPRPSRRAS